MQDLNILIVGGGVAGLTFAGLLEQQGAHYQVIEKEDVRTFNSSGYMLGLLPLGGRVLNELNLRNEYFEQSIQMENYEIHKEDGTLNKEYSLGFINEKYGSYRGIERKKLIEILLKSLNGDQVEYGTTLKSIQQDGSKVKVIFSNGQKASYDLVILADGMHSKSRKLLWEEDEYEFGDTGWGGWVGWINDAQMDSYKEYWGASSFIGLYPVKDRIGIFLGGPNEKIESLGLQDFIREISRDIKPEFDLLHDALHNLSRIESPYYWEFHDCRTNEW